MQGGAELNEKFEVPLEAAAAIEAGVSPPLAFREAGAISPSDLGQSTDISAERLLQIEEGAVATESELRDLSQALGVPLQHLAVR